ncbi:MAG: four helix bundle protein [Acidobacteriota bacterium]
MRTEHAPLHAVAETLAHQLHSRTARFPRHQRFVLARRLQDASWDLLEAVTLALQFKTERDRRLDQADEALTRLRLGVRLATELGLFSNRQARGLHGEITEAGRMLGGWKRSRRGSHSGS